MNLILILFPHCTVVLHQSISLCEHYSLSLSMFEALRGLRDAVAPDSGNAAVSSSDQDDFEEFWQLFKSGDPETLALVQKATAGNADAPNKNATKQRDEARWIYAKIEMNKDTELVAKLASDVLHKSAEVDRRVAGLSGMNRTKLQQMDRIQHLLDFNQDASKELEESYQLAATTRDQVRRVLREKTCQALGIDEEQQE